MYKIALPISKSIANRLLLLQAIHGDPLMRVSADMPDDVIVLHDALEQLQTLKLSNGAQPQTPLVLNLKNSGTALRFLQVHLEKCYPDAPVTLTGDPRLMERDGKPTTQTTSARILHGEQIQVQEKESPYITMSRRIRDAYLSPSEGDSEKGTLLERDWSSAAFWYEYVAIHGGELMLEGLTRETLQGDKMVAEIYGQYFGVVTSYTSEGAKIYKSAIPIKDRPVTIDFENIPDLYPGIAYTCERLGLPLHATGVARLKYKESNRLRAVRLHEVQNDHRMAMALIVAGFIHPKPDTEEWNGLQTIIAKSYPDFLENFKQVCSESRRSTDGQPTVKPDETCLTITHITPIRGVNDDNLGKKHALSKLIHAAKTEYIWMHDDDVILPEAVHVRGGKEQFPKEISGDADLVILPLRMESGHERPTLLESLQTAEYAAIQELTMRTAKKGRAAMCSGANLIVRREAWLECENELHPEIPSGDDMFLLEAMKRRGMQIAVIDKPDYTAVVRPVAGWRAFFRQRMRWAGKAPKYTDKDILRCGALVVTANILQLLCPLVLLIKFPIEYGLIRKREISNYQSPITNHQSPSTQKPRTKWYVALLLEIVYPVYLLVSLLGGLFRQKEW